MAKEICTVCGREIDSRGMSGHMKTHKAEPEGDDNDGVISYPSNNQEESTETVPEHDLQGKNTVHDTEKPMTKKKPVKKPAASKPASSTASKPNPRGEHKTETEHKEEWKGFFRD